MRITESRGSRTTTLFIVGKIDDSTGPGLQNEIFRVAKLTKNVTLDFNDVESIKGVGIKALQTSQRIIGSRRGELKVLNANAKVRTELQKENLGKLLVY